ncbi:MAG TPA: hypothetical protein VLS51_07205, partial [Propionibacteriaceae bacterium]|nr:hypothetical protein [Propionibacteriaceae bacterium]
VTVSRQGIGELATEFVALGTAVRDRAGGTAARPFVTDLGGADVAKALSSGWIPVSLAFGISVAVLGGGWQAYRQLARQTRRWAGNTEVVAYSELLGRARADARDQFRADAARAAADAAVVSGMSVEMLRYESGRESEVHGAQAVVTGSTMARFRGSSSPPVRTLTVLPLRTPAAATGDVS